MSNAEDTQAFINILNTGHPGSITSPNQAGLPEAFDRFLAVTKSIQPDVKYQGEVQEVLSRRKARKLAYQYKGGNRSVRYIDFLAERMTDFWIEGKRLVREPKTMRAKAIVLHAESVVATPLLGTSKGALFKFDLETSSGHTMIVGPTRTGMSVSPVIPVLSDLFSKAKR
jgi:hypothetical protein